MKRPQVLGIHARPGTTTRRILAVVPFLLMIAIYAVASDIRHQSNPNDKLLPGFGQMADSFKAMAFEKDKRSGKRLLLVDTVSSLKRLFIGITCAAFIGLFLGLGMGMFPGANAAVNPFVTFLSMIPPLAVLPILFITFGVDELAKVVLIIVGVFPLIARDIRLSVLALPSEQVTKALTLGASEMQLAFKILLPQIMPRLLQAIRLTLGAAWLFLIASEAIAASEGLGYRIFLVRRYLAMDIILPYVLWITLIGISIDLLLKTAIQRFFPWYEE